VKIPFFQLDAFARARFSGNPAGVCPLESWIYDTTMQAIAAENHLPATAFFVPRRGEFDIRWFTPRAELTLCGHATLAAAWLVLHELEPRRDQVVFHSPSGDLTATRDGERVALTLPRHDAAPLTPPPPLAAALGAAPAHVLAGGGFYLCAFDDALAVTELAPDGAALATLDKHVIATAPGGAHGCDFVSRVFVPRAGTLEDPVTGSAHCVLAPYWAARLSRDALFAKQLSQRGGELWCTLAAGGVTLSGRVVPYLAGEVDV
jgi:PhzF family phenazine biosynthesis protein